MKDTNERNNSCTIVVTENELGYGVLSLYRNQHSTKSQTNTKNTSTEITILNSRTCYLEKTQPLKTWRNKDW